MLITHDRHVIRVDGAVDKDGDLHVFTSSSGIFLTPAEQDALIQHLIQVRGVGRVQELLSSKWDGTDRRVVGMGADGL